MSVVETHFGDSPLVLSLPHTGTYMPAEIAARLNATGAALADTDWHIHQLYDGQAAGASTVRATFHRYVIDANRDPAGQSLYPGQNTTGLCPTTDFDGLPIYRNGAEPAADEVAARAQKFHAPYHAALAGALARAKARHGFALLYDCHSIRSHIPFLFDGVLPDFNIGTNLGTTCAADIGAGVLARSMATGQSCVLNGRFKGGWTVRHYGQPQIGVHAIQMELAQSTYLASEAAPWAYDTAKAAGLRSHLKDILTFLSHWRPQ
ncbi:MAG: N-formylglutamate deformylase [Paracoccaceae bacterium]